MVRLDGVYAHELHAAPQANVRQFLHLARKRSTASSPPRPPTLLLRWLPGGTFLHVSGRRRGLVKGMSLRAWEVLNAVSTWKRAYDPSPSRTSMSMTCPGGCLHDVEGHLL